MSESEPTPPTIDYAPIAQDEIPFIRQMLWWRSMCGELLLTTAIVLLLSNVVRRGSTPEAALHLIAFICYGATTLSAIMAIIYMGRAALNEMGAWYAVRHIVLALLLSPFMFIGVWWIPGVVMSDLIKWRAVEERDDAPLR